MYQQVCGYAYQVDPVNEPGALIVKFAGPPGEYNVLATGMLYKLKNFVKLNVYLI